MATIDDLPRKSISEMTEQELVELLRKRRSARIVSEEPRKKKAKPGERAAKAAEKEKKVAGKSPAELLAMMSPEQKRTLINAMSRDKYSDGT